MAIYNAESCSHDHVVAAIALASDSDTVTIPSGECTWEEGIEVDKEIAIIGAGIDSTIINNYGFGFTDGTHNWRLSGMTLDGQTWLDRHVISIGSSAHGEDKVSCQNFRIDHIKVMRYINYAWSRNYHYGLVDNCIFLDNAGEEWLLAADDISSWERDQCVPAYINGCVIFEDCTWEQTGAASAQSKQNCVDAQLGARYCVRHCIITSHSTSTWNRMFEVHGYDSFPDGGVSVEIYKNTVNVNTESQNFLHVRGGRGVCWDNTFLGVGANAASITLTNYRSCYSNFGDDACRDNEGYPCIGQLNNFYIWGNDPSKTAILDDDPGGSGIDLDPKDWAGAGEDHGQLDRDYFQSAMPGYTGYTYPHPLRGVGAKLVMVLS